jgi:hypothetical protein
MTFPRVHEMPLPMEPVAHDTFIDDVPATMEHPREEAAPEPPAPRPIFVGA